MDVTEALLDSWDRQCRIVNALGSRIDESNRHLKPTPDGMPIFHQLAHIHNVRQHWLRQFDPERGAKLKDSFVDGWQTPIQDLPTIKTLLNDSAKEIREAVGEAIKKGVGSSGGYDNPVLFLQHMIWHEGWHVGLILTALRIAGQEPPAEWEEANVWGEWRTEIW